MQLYTMCYLRAYYCGQYCHIIAIDPKRARPDLSWSKSLSHLQTFSLPADINSSKAEIPLFTSVRVGPPSSINVSSVFFTCAVFQSVRPNVLDFHLIRILSKRIP